MIIFIYVQHMFKIVLVALLILAGTSSLQGVTDLTDANFEQLVKQDSSIWLVLFAADWCGHCKHLKPHIQKLAPRLERLGVKVGQVDEKNHKLVNDYVVDHNTHMVSYPKLKVFLGEEQLADVPPGLRTEDQIYHWVKSEFSLTEPTQEEL